MAGEIWFYHLENSSPDSVLPDLLEKSLSRGWRALVRSPDEDRIDSLDQSLWTYRDDAFLPHGKAEDADPDKQPILLTSGADNLNQAQVAFLLDRAEPARLDEFERTILLFDGADDAALADARKFWKSASAEGRSVSYWKQTGEGRWEKKA